MASKLFKTSLILLAVGIAILAIIQIVYMPKFVELQNDALNWVNSTNRGTPPTLEEYGLNNTTMILIPVFGTVANVLVLIGVAYLVIFLLAKIIKRVRGYDVEKSEPEIS